MAPAVIPTRGLDVVVLAGGASRRMGRDKALLEVDGRRLVDLVADRMAAVADHVVVASGPRPLGRDDEVADAPDCHGPLAGLLAALRGAQAPYLGVVPVDAPSTDPRVLARLHDVADRAGRSGAVVCSDGHVQALHAVLATAALPAIESRVRAGERSPRSLLAWLDVARVDVDGWGDLDPSGAMARDWDRPEDLPPGV